MTKRTPAKSYGIDPIPTTLLYMTILTSSCQPSPTSFLTTGIVPCDLKTAIVKFLLKKPSLEYLAKNYHPISNLPSKSLKKSFFTNFSSIFKQTTSATPLSQHRNRLVTCCKRHSLRSGQWHFCSSAVRFFCSFWHYWPSNSPLPPLFSFWYSVHCTQMDRVISLRQMSVHFSKWLILATITAHVRCAWGLGAGARSLRPVHHLSLWHC